MNGAVNKLLAVAVAEIGYLEKKSNTCLDDKTKNAGSGNYTKYARDMIQFVGSPYAQAAAWCDTFVDWCFVKAFGSLLACRMLGGWSAYTPTSAGYYKQMNRWAKDPQVGDQVFFKNSTRICHTGIVCNVNQKYIYTIEGNTSGASGLIANGGGVCKKRYDRNYAKIAGYGRPRYELVEPDTSERYFHDGIDFSPVFDAAYYGDRYQDLKTAFGTDADALFGHFVTFGMKEARRASGSFDVVAYRKAYCDLNDAFGDKWEEYYKHYCLAGKEEIEKGQRKKFM